MVDLSDQWRGYRAAKKALDNILTAANITAAANQNLQWFREAKAELAGFLTEGVLTDSFVLHHLQPLVECMRKANVALRWRLLHKLCRQPKFKELIDQQVDGRAVIDLLLQSAQLEFRVRRLGCAPSAHFWPAVNTGGGLLRIYSRVLGSEPAANMANGFNNPRGKEPGRRRKGAPEDAR